MADESSSGGDSSPINLTSILALVTLVGGLWLVSHRLTSDRPVAPAGGAQEFIGDQKLEARLWEDPFKSVESEATKNESKLSDTNLQILVDQIKARCKVTEPVLLLPVMLSGGQFSEDQESRIRSRYAVVSALGRSGFAPENAEHIGALTLPWLTEHEIELAKALPHPGIKKMWTQAAPGSEKPATRLLDHEASASMELRYEWYRPRTFSPVLRTQGDKPQLSVLVLWLDDSYFEDQPLLRLPLLLEPLTEACRSRLPAQPDVALIGPRRSSTLRAMLPEWGDDKDANGKTRSVVGNADLQPLAQKVLKRVAIYCATPSAVDEVLVKETSRWPRDSVGRALLDQGFGWYHNLAATDAQLAEEALKELALRGADPRKMENHIVLISEWDTFYARMLQLTYRAELARWQVKQPGLSNPVRAAFVNSFRDRTTWTNVHSFVYLRGLDGQTISGDAGAEKNSARDSGGPPTSLDELRHWLPDVNKAEGQAQLDYLGRLGDQLDELEETITRKNAGHIRAIGIVGSDVYDTLLILQALRARFPDVIFFTTDLDVRFLHPSEREWARNLVVTSSYGLTLNRDLQGEVAPFRDSTQTAQFAAVLAALGTEDLGRLKFVPPRRFEIGNGVAVDLSVVGATAPLLNSAGAIVLHPLTRQELHRQDSGYELLKLNYAAWVVTGLLLGLCWLWGPLRRLTFGGFGFAGSALTYGDEDIGGPDGAEKIVANLPLHAGRIAYWIATHEEIESRAAILRQNPASLDQAVRREKEKVRRELAETLVIILNQLLQRQADLVDKGKVARAVRQQADRLKAGWIEVRVKSRTQFDRVLGEVTADPWRHGENENTVAAPDVLEHAHAPKGFVGLLEKWHRTNRVLRRWRARKYLDRFLIEVSVLQASPTFPAPDHGTSALHAATAARESSRKIFCLRCWRLLWFWGIVIFFGAVAVVLARTIWNDTLLRTEGEPFSLTNGTSAWPAQIIRLIVAALSVGFVFGLNYRVRETFFGLTRKFRFDFKAEKRTAFEGVCAVELWQNYRKEGRFTALLLRVLVAVVVYFGLLAAAAALPDQPVFSPVRGEIAMDWNLGLLFAALLGVLLLAFFTIDAARLCCGFIRQLGGGPTRYPDASRRHFSRERGEIDDEYLDEWIDLQLIADLTEQFGALVYCPTLLVFLLVLARNSWWDHWSWPAPLLVVFCANFALALASVVILQRAAWRAKAEAEESLGAKIKRLQAEVEENPETNDANQATQLLDEIRNLRRGAFVPFWKNPVVGALFLSSGGTTALQLLIWFMGR